MAETNEIDQSETKYTDWESHRKKKKIKYPSRPIKQIFPIQFVVIWKIPLFFLFF